MKNYIDITSEGEINLLEMTGDKEREETKGKDNSLSESTETENVKIENLIILKTIGTGIISKFKYMLLTDSCYQESFPGLSFLAMKPRSSTTP